MTSSRSSASSTQVQPPSQSVTYFYVTGFPKSGNKWLQKALFSFESVGGFNNRSRKGLPLLGASLIRHRRLRKRLHKAGVSFEEFVKRLYDPRRTQPPLDLSRRDRTAVTAALDELAIIGSKMNRGVDTRRLFRHVLQDAADGGRGSRSSPLPDRDWRAVGLPGMHTPIAQVRKLLPSFKVVHLLRDPRDVVVSYFYHQVSTLTYETALEFVRVGRFTGRVQMRPNWKRFFARRMWKRLLAYYRETGTEEAGRRVVDDHDPATTMIMRLRYEDLLSSPVEQMERVLAFLGTTESHDVMDKVMQGCSFARRAGAPQEQRNSLLRKGQSGDWLNYFDRELLEGLGTGFITLVRTLGYEPDDSWVQRVPETAPRPLEFSRFRMRRSSVRQFVSLWHASRELRERFPNPWDPGDEGTFYAWLRSCDHRPVRRWFVVADQLQSLWRVDVVEKRTRWQLAMAGRASAGAAQRRDE